MAATLNLDFLRDPNPFGTTDKQHEMTIDPSEMMKPTCFPLPSGEQLEQTKEAFCCPGNPGIKFKHGTTTMAFVFDHGVLVAVDSRSTMGPFIGSGSVEKVLKISPYILGTMAGGAADCAFWERNLTVRCNLHELREGKRITVAAASKLLGNTMYSYRGYGLAMGTMVAGYDEIGGPSLYYVDDAGTRLKGQRFSVGSGATFAYGILDDGYKPDLTVDEAVELGKRAIYHATHRDAYSGAVINVFYIGPDGWVQKFRGDMNELHYGQYAKERADAEAAGATESKHE